MLSMFLRFLCFCVFNDFNDFILVLHPSINNTFHKAKVLQKNKKFLEYFL